MGKIQRYYYDSNCNKIEVDDDDLHDEIARKVINKNPELLKEYNEIRKKGIISESVFLTMKGYIYIGGSTEYNMSAMYSSISLNENTRNLMTDLKEDGYYIYDIIRNELRDEQKEQIRSWARTGMERSEIANKVMTDMLVLLAPTKNNTKHEDELDER